MRRLSGVLLAGVILLLPALSQNAHAQQKFTLDGDLAILSVAVNPDKTADYEAILAKLKEVLGKSESAEARQQLAGWRVMKIEKPQPDGRIVYSHIITPVPGADYSILQVIYTVVTDPTEQKALYDQYRAAFSSNLSLLSGPVIIDMAK